MSHKTGIPSTSGFTQSIQLRVFPVTVRSRRASPATDRGSGYWRVVMFSCSGAIPARKRYPWVIGQVSQRQTVILSTMDFVVAGRTYGYLLSIQDRHHPCESL